MPKNSIFSPSAKIKTCTLSKAPPPVWPHHQHTHKSSKNFTYGFVLRPLQFQSTSQNTHLTSKTVILAVVALKRNSTHLHSNPEPSFRKLNSLPTKLHMLFPTHLQAGELCPQTYSLSLPLEWSQVTHTSTSIKLGRAYKPEKSAFYSTFARQLCDDTCLPGWLFAFPVHSQTFKPTQARFAHTNSQASHSTSYKIFLVFFYFLEDFFKVPPSLMKVLPDHYKGLQATSKGHAPLVDSSCRHGRV